MPHPTTRTFNTGIQETVVDQGEIDYLDDGVFMGLIKDTIAGERVINNVAFGSEGKSTKEDFISDSQSYY
ncbi:hypothetical protein AB3S75_045392 [Citrus x aurantiifolia]